MTRYTSDHIRDGERGRKKRTKPNKFKEEKKNQKGERKCTEATEETGRRDGARQNGKIQKFKGKILQKKTENIQATNSRERERELNERER